MEPAELSSTRETASLGNGAPAPTFPQQVLGSSLLDPSPHFLAVPLPACACACACGTEMSGAASSQGPASAHASLPSSLASRAAGKRCRWVSAGAGAAGRAAEGPCAHAEQRLHTETHVSPTGLLPEDPGSAVRRWGCSLHSLRGPRPSAKGRAGCSQLSGLRGLRQPPGQRGHA